MAIKIPKKKSAAGVQEAPKAMQPTPIKSLSMHEVIDKLNKQNKLIGNFIDPLPKTTPGSEKTKYEPVLALKTQPNIQQVPKKKPGVFGHLVYHGLDIGSADVSAVLQAGITAGQMYDAVQPPHMEAEYSVAEKKYKLTLFTGKKKKDENGFWQDEVVYTHVTHETFQDGGTKVYLDLADHLAAIAKLDKDQVLSAMLLSIKDDGEGWMLPFPKAHTVSVLQKALDATSQASYGTSLVKTLVDQVAEANDLVAMVPAQNGKTNIMLSAIAKAKKMGANVLVQSHGQMDLSGTMTGALAHFEPKAKHQAFCEYLKKMQFDYQGKVLTTPHEASGLNAVDMELMDILCGTIVVPPGTVLSANGHLDLTIDISELADAFVTISDKVAKVIDTTDKAPGVMLMLLKVIGQNDPKQAKWLKVKDTTFEKLALLVKKAQSEKYAPSAEGDDLENLFIPTPEAGPQGQNHVLHQLIRNLKYVATKDQDFATDLISQAQWALKGQGKPLSAKQWYWVGELAKKAATTKKNAKAAPVKPVEVDADGVPDFTQLVDVSYLFDGPYKALASAWHAASKPGFPTPVLFIKTLFGEYKLTKSPATFSENLAVAFNTSGGGLAAIINPLGDFSPTAKLNPESAQSVALHNKLKLFCDNPFDYVADYHQMTKKCAFCENGLSGFEAKDYGAHEKCAKRWFGSGSLKNYLLV